MFIFNQDILTQINLWINECVEESNSVKNYINIIILFHCWLLDVIFVTTQSVLIRLSPSLSVLYDNTGSVEPIPATKQILITNKGR